MSAKPLDRKEMLRKYSMKLKARPGNHEDNENRDSDDGPRLSVKLQQKQYQKNRMKKEIREAAQQKADKERANSTGKIGKKLTDKAEDLMGKVMEQVKETIEEHPLLLLIAALLLLVVIIVVAVTSSASLLGGGGEDTMVITTFTADDSDILAVDADYSSLEQGLREKIGNIETDNPGYDEYQYDLAEIGHNPYELAAYLTVTHEDYREDEVQAELQSLFEEEYVLTLTPKTETRMKTVTRTGTRPIYSGNTITGTESYTYDEEVEYEYKILQVKLTNKALDTIARGRIDDEQLERYDILLETKGNKSYLFEGTTSDGEGGASGGSPGIVYEPSGEALSDSAFASMWQEAQKYLGRRYVWGGSSPSTGFDCSGYVSWVINHSGVGSCGRKTAEGLREWTDTIPASERKPGDLIFFQGTYATNGASHVGIYIGDGKMIHCGDPIKVSNVDSGYFKQHFLCYGRIPQ